MTPAITRARERMRARAAATALSVARAKSARDCGSWVKACTVRSADTVSSASAAKSAMRSCATRDRVRSRRENSARGTTTNGTTPTTTRDSAGLVTTSMARAPTSSTMLRSHWLTAEPARACSTAVSAIRRDSTSPVRAVSNHAGESVVTWSNTARRRSAPTRSPNQVTRAKRQDVAAASPAITTATPSAVALRRAWLPVAMPPSTSRRTAWPRSRTSPDAASRQKAAAIPCHL